MIGDTYTINGEEFEVTWAGGEGLIPDRATKVGDFWTAPPRAYNKKSAYWTQPRTKSEPPNEAIDNAEPEAEDGFDEQRPMVLRGSDQDEDLSFDAPSEEPEGSNQSVSD